MKPISNWLELALVRACRLVEDSDRKARADKLWFETIRRVHRLAIAGAHDTPGPRLERFVTGEVVLLSMKWDDHDALWDLEIGVQYSYRQKPVVWLAFFGNPDNVEVDSPDDAAILRAMHGYFESWKVQR